MDATVGNARLIQKMNRIKVLNFVRNNPDTPRNIIAKETGLSLASLTNITAYLIANRLIKECGPQKAARVGRKSTLLKFDADAYGLICISPGINKVSVFYTNLEGKIIDSAHKSAKDISPDAAVDFVREYILSLIQKCGRQKILAIGISISGLVLDGSRFVVSSSLKWKEFNIKSIIEKDTGIPVFVENMSLLKGVWYFFCNRNDEKCDNMVFVDMENGIGSCQFYKGAINRAMLGEIGHTTVKSDGEQCFCGNKGCLEAMCSVDRIAKLYTQYSGNNANFEQVVQLYKSSDIHATAAIEKCAHYLGIGIANLVNICKPNVIVFNIGQFAQLPRLIELAMNETKTRAYPALLEDLKLRIITVTEQEAVQGAAFNLCDRIFDIGYNNSIIE